MIFNFQLGLKSAFFACCHTLKVPFSWKLYHALLGGWEKHQGLFQPFWEKAPGLNWEKIRVSAGLKFTLDILSKQPKYCSDIWIFLRTFFNIYFYHHQQLLPSALLKLKPGVFLLPFWMVSAAWLIVRLFISWGDWSLLIGGSGWGTVFAAFCGRCTTR